MMLVETRLIDGTLFIPGRRFGQLPLRIAIQKARVGWWVCTWNEGLDGWRDRWRPTHDLARRLHAELVGEAVLGVYIVDRGQPWTWAIVPDEEG